MSEKVINLPHGYKRCLFLQSTGTQYINTNHVATINTGAYVEWSLTNIKKYSNVLCSIGTSSDANADCIFMLPHWNGDNNAYLTSFISRVSGGFRLENQESPNLYSRYSSKLNYFNNKSAYINNTLMGTFETEINLSANDLPLYLFGCNKLNSLSTGDSMIGRIYCATITEGEEVVMDLIPCLDDNGKPCMYDLVTQTPFYNANTEEEDFSYELENRLPKRFKRLQYLQDTGTQYIDTNYIPSNTTGLFVDAQQITQSSSPAVGCRNDANNTRIYPPYLLKNTGNQCGYGWGSYVYIGYIGNGKRHEGYINFYNNRIARLLVDNEVLKTSSTLPTLTFTFNLPLHLFGYNDGSTGKHVFWKGRIYSAKITEGNELVRHFVPAFDTEEQRPCMYDLIEGIPYYNAGSGEFLYNKGFEGSYTRFGQLSGIGNRLGGGVDGLPPTYTRVNYLESTGIENIKLPTPNLYETHELFTVVTDCQFLSENKTRMGFIARGGLSWGTDYTKNRNGRLVAGSSGSPFLLDVFGRNRNVVTYSTTYYFTEDGTPHPSDTPTGNTTWTQTISVGDKKSGGGNGNGKLPDTWDYGVFLVSYEATTVSYPVRIWSCKCWCDSVSYDLIPCLDDNGRPCMFDRVSRKTFYNSGTGEFLYG